jgi:hypothetical protein
LIIIFPMKIAMNHLGCLHGYLLSPHPNGWPQLGTSTVSALPAGPGWNLREKVGQSAGNHGFFPWTMGCPADFRCDGARMQVYFFIIPRIGLRDL